MAHSSATNMTWSCLNTKEDLFNTFLGCVDREIIELVVENHNNNLLLAYRTLEEITKAPKSDQNLHILSNEEEKQTETTTNSNIHNTIDWDCLSKNETPTNRIVYLVSRGYKVMLLMRGCPGSGKSYQATSILNQCYENANEKEFIFSADKFFINKNTGRYCYNRSKLNIAHQWTYENVQKAVQYEVTPVIIDNTNIVAWEMENYIKLGVNNGYWIEIIEPNSKWAWDVEELFQKNVHNVPYDSIMSMIQRYDHSINVENLFSRFKLKYSKKNQPPQLSCNSKKYQLCKNLIGGIKIDIKSQIALDNFKDLHISPKEYNNENQFISFDNNDEDPCENIIQDKGILSVVNKCANLLHNISDEDNQSISSTEEASNYINKSINTDENDFLFMGVLNEIPEEEYISYVIIGSNRDINEGNQSILNIPNEKLDKGTTTHDLLEAMYKLNLNELHKQFPENVCSLISELFDKCKGNIEWIVDMLVESGHDISKQQLCSTIQFEENVINESIPVQDTIKKSKQNNVQSSQDNNTAITSQNLLQKSITFNENKIIEEVEGKKKKRRKKIIQNDFKGPKSQVSDKNLRENIENKFVFGDSLYSDHVLKIKKFKENKSILDDDNVKLESLNNDLKSIKNDTQYVQIVMDTSVLTQLCDYFGDFSSDLNKNSLPMSVKLPEKLAEDLYYCLIANVPTDIFNQEAILQDEFMARKLQEECKNEISSNISNSNTGELTFAAVLSKQLLLEKFKNIDSKAVLNVLRDNNYKFQDANDQLSELAGIKCSTNHVDPSIGVENENTYPNEIEHKSNNYQQEALEHAHSRQQFLNKANQSLSAKKHPAVTAYYLDKAEEYKQNEKCAKTRAYTNMIRDNKNATTLDLHYLPVSDAILVLDLYLDYHISNLKKFNERYNRGRHLTIITGRGKHSPRGIARIKPVVVRRLQDRQLMYFESEETPGLIMVIIKKSSLLSS